MNIADRIHGQMFPTRNPLPSGLTTSVVPIVMFSLTSCMFGIVVFSVTKINKKASEVKLKKNTQNPPWMFTSTCVLQVCAKYPWKWHLLGKTHFCLKNMKSKCEPDTFFFWSVKRTHWNGTIISLNVSWIRLINCFLKLTLSQTLYLQFWPMTPPTFIGIIVNKEARGRNSSTVCLESEFLSDVSYITVEPLSNGKDMQHFIFACLFYLSAEGLYHYV